MAYELLSGQSHYQVERFDGANQSGRRLVFDPFPTELRTAYYTVSIHIPSGASWTAGSISVYGTIPRIDAQLQALGTPVKLPVTKIDTITYNSASFAFVGQLTEGWGLEIKTSSDFSGNVLAVIKG